jgi:predicted nuclease of predicted toxin-antitoxin system
MRFLADESCDFVVVRALRAAGHDVQAVSDLSPGVDDEGVADLARREDCLLLTEDKDFGQLFYAAAGPETGVILIRFPGNARRSLAPAVLQVIDQRGEALRGCFVVVQPGRVRILPPPSPPGAEEHGDQQP